MNDLAFSVHRFKDWFSDNNFIKQYHEEKGFKLNNDGCVIKDSKDPPLRIQRCFDVNLMVSDVIDFQGRKWNRRKLEELFVSSDIRILDINQPSVSEPDYWVWRHIRSEIYSVKTGHDLAFYENKKDLIRSKTENPSLNPVMAQVWHIQAHSKIKVFIWKSLSGAISVLDALRSRGVRCDTVCQTCGMDWGTVNHVLFSCTMADQVWAISGIPSPMGGFDDASVFANVSYLFATWKNREEGSCLMENKRAQKLKAVEEANFWFLGQYVEQGIGSARSNNDIWHSNEGYYMPREVFKCNIGMRWSKKKMEVGAAWVFRDSKGLAVIHSCRYFVGVRTRDEAYFLSVACTVESMISHKCRKVYFAFEGRPRAWPSFKYKILEHRRLFGELSE